MDDSLEISKFSCLEYMAFKDDRESGLQSPHALSDAHFYALTRMSFFGGGAVQIKLCCS